MEFTAIDVPADQPSAFAGQKATLNASIQEVIKKYEPRIQSVKDEGAQLKDDAPHPETVEAIINVDFTVTWSDQKIAFDFPSVTIKDQKISFDLPEVRMDTQRIVFDVPSIRMVDRIIGHKPEFHGINVEWTPIIVSLPEPYSQTIEIKLDLPSVTMKTQEIIIGIPEFKMERVEWIIGLPQFTVTEVSAATTKLADKGKELKTEGEAIGVAMKSEIDFLVAQFMQGVGGVSGALQTTKNTFNSALTLLSTAITDLSAKGVDPIKVPTDGGNVNLRKQYEELIATRDDVIPKMEAMATDPAVVPTAAVALIPA